ncbi:hypothetical protein J437_LFUL014637 [Ladona fulva]|uniref:Uncharacterized protein n=1 Tax=Ladona fulva TaxID=123851 RepID=A0A8K0KIV5_LADFU|nr:hypothetical protein J437_LFUL014637 [Ladona fulva]
MSVDKGVDEDPDKVTTMMDMLQPISITEVKRVLRMVQYQLKFTLCSPLNAETEFTWTPVQKVAADLCKRKGQLYLVVLDNFPGSQKLPN